MRIIAGRFRGRVLTSFQGDHIRPTTDRVKETIFNKLQFLLEDASVLDLFSGTGNLAIEALSRGASRIVAVDSHKDSVAIIYKNLKLLQIEDEIEVYKKDVLTFVESFSGEPFQLVFIDPPFTKKMADEVMQAMSKSSVVVQGGQVVIESSRHEKIGDEYSGYTLLDRRDFGDKSVSFFQRT